jgi:prepilin-type N-terminal cleavage/methylation domain-containing protein
MRKRQSGVTLVELLIAITLVAALSAGMLIAIRSSLTAMERINVRLEENRRVMGIQQIVSRQIGGAIPAMDCPLTGTPEAMRLVTAYSISEGVRGFPRVVMFRIEPDPAGGNQLVEVEAPYAKTGCGGESAGPGVQTLVLANRLVTVRFFYHAPPEPNSGAPGAWTQSWNAPGLPSAVRIETLPMNGVASNLPALAVNAQIRIRRLPVTYIDAE